VTLSRDHLAVFARTPVAGACKTRLIPHLGPHGAAAVACQLGRHTLAEADAWRAATASEGAVTLWLAGEPDKLPAAWNSAVTVAEQPAGDLGQRLEVAIQTEFDRGAQRVVVIGTDCPGVDRHLLVDAFRALHHTDVVLGPALDGGYTLIGLKQPHPDLFRQMPWSTEHLLDATRSRLRQLNLSWTELATLGDIDTPDDLPRFARLAEPVTDGGLANPHLVSLLIPSRGDARLLAQTLAAVRDAATGPVELIVHATADELGLHETATEFNAAIYIDDRPRAVRLNAGAALAQGAALLCLHADARVPPGFDAAIRETLTDRSISLGAFSLAIDGTQPALATIARGANWRSSVCKLPYGDQGLFCRASDFWRVGGFPPWPLLDDVALVRKLTRRGRLALLPDPIIVSARRWQRLGPVRTTLLNQAILAAWFLGVPPETLARWYRR
jgi:rSAM/selenodomain-associated transferase 1/rSAM/selenodomain-associated transferase 2